MWFFAWVYLKVEMTDLRAGSVTGYEPARQ